MNEFSERTKELAAIVAARDIAPKFLDEIDRLLRTGAVDLADHSRGLLFGIALENIADNYLRGDKKTREYRNLKRF